MGDVEVEVIPATGRGLGQGRFCPGYLQSQVQKKGLATGRGARVDPEVSGRPYAGGNCEKCHETRAVYTDYDSFSSGYRRY